MYKKTFTIPFLLVSTVVVAQSVSTMVGGRPAGMGYATPALYDNYGIFSNVSGITKITSHNFAACYEITPSLQGASRRAAAVNLKLKPFVLAFGMFRFGDDVYSEQIISAGLANKLGIASLGAKVNLVQYSAKGFGTKFVVSTDFGGIVDFTKELSFGAYIVNLNQPVLDRETEEHLPTKLHAGFAFTPSDKVVVCTSLEKDLEYDPTWKAGFEYDFHQKFFARTGYNLNPNTSFFGLGFKSSRIKFDYALSHNYMIGMTHQASIVYHPSSRESISPR